MKKTLKWTGIIFMVLIVIMVVYSLFGMQKTLQLDIESVDMSQIQDGVYTGSYECYRWSNTVAVTVKDHQITYVEPIKIQDGRDSLFQALTQSILDHQTPEVDAVSGATASSNGYLKAVETALKNAW